MVENHLGMWVKSEKNQCCSRCEDILRQYILRAVQAIDIKDANRVENMWDLSSKIDRASEFEHYCQSPEKWYIFLETKLGCQDSFWLFLNLSSYDLKLLA